LTEFIAKTGQDASGGELGDDVSQESWKEKSLSSEGWPCFTAIFSSLALFPFFGSG